MGTRPKKRKGPAAEKARRWVPRVPWEIGAGCTAFFHRGSVQTSLQPWPQEHCEHCEDMMIRIALNF